MSEKVGVVSLSEIMPEVCRQFFKEDVVCSPLVWERLTATARQSTLQTVVQDTLCAGSKMLLRSSNTGGCSHLHGTLAGRELYHEAVS